MTKREAVKSVLEGRKPPYVPWSFSFTKKAEEKLQAHFTDFDPVHTCGNHILALGHSVGFFEYIGKSRYRDVFGVIWNRSVDADIGVVERYVLPGPAIGHYRMPDPSDPRFFEDIEHKIAKYPDLFRVYQIGFSLYERAWTMRGMENLMMDFYDNPDFVHALMGKIADYNIELVKQAVKYDIDAVYFGDDWGQQQGLQMGPGFWRQFIKPELKRMYLAVREAGKYVFIHSCGDVDELFDELVEIGLDCFNPFQPEVMDVESLISRYRGRLAFFGGLSTQKTLPYADTGVVRAKTRQLIRMGGNGGLILAPAHAVEGDVPLSNMLALIEEARGQISE